MPNRCVLQAQTEGQVDGKQDSARLNGVVQWHVREGGEGEERMIKPDRDPKLYRVISLTNGLTVCLVSDPRCSPLAEDEHLDDNFNDIDSADDDSEDDDVDEDYESDGEDCEDGESSDSETEEGNKRRHHPSQRQSAAALCVAVGSFSDPPEVQGLAHLLEHMVFMGNSRYPSENGFDAFLKRHGGTDNAFTDTHMTTFILGCPRRSFARALNRWAQFFVSPLLREDAVSRETEAVDSEFQEALLSDSTRWEALVSSLARQGHPMGNFSWGNRKSLQCHGLPKSLREFWENHYSANHMTLTVQSQDSLDHLEHLVTKIFSDIPQNNRPKPDFSHVGPAFEPSVLHRLYRGMTPFCYSEANVT
uniref:Nardilysin n=1 Tax=Eptatretus burgeri TaxID=7764 RepID=A0A8C4WZP8_EPTBU